jgi:dolichyl-phosphate beta-glucosyltransferase
MTTEWRGRPYLSIVVPAYDEERRLGASLSRISSYTREEKIDAELLVVDDGSRDATPMIVEEALRDMRGKLLRNAENRGKGFSVRRGVLEASGRWVLVTDADLSTPIEEIAKLSAAARDRDLDAAIGSRALRESRIEKRQNALRETMGKTFNLIIRAMTGLKFQDTQCGFKLLDRERTLPLFRHMVVDRFAFDVEFLYLCWRFGLRVEEVPIIWRDSPGSRVGLVTDPMNMLWDVARVVWRFRRGLYNPAAGGRDARAAT